MPLIYERPFRIRMYECDAYGHVNHANYLRYMQEAAIEAAADAGYDNERHESIGTFWLIRDTDIEYLKPLVYGDQLVVRTWVEDFRRVRSRRRYDFFKNGQEEPIARANTDWIYLNRSSLRPEAIPESLIRAFAPEGISETPTPRKPFPEPLPPPPGISPQRRLVEWRDVDHVGHVNNAVYLSYNEDAGLRVARKTNWDINDARAEGWGIYTRRNRIEYRVPAQLGDELEIDTWLSPPGNTSITRYYRMHRASDGQLLVQAYSIWVFVNLQSGEPIPVPSSFLDTFSENISR